MIVNMFKVCLVSYVPLHSSAEQCAWCKQMTRCKQAQYGTKSKSYMLWDNAGQIEVTNAKTVMIWNSLFCFCLCFCLFIEFHYQYYSIQLSVIFMHSCSPVMSLCFCMIWAWTHPESAAALFGYFRNSGIFIDSLLVFWNFPLLS